ncbi:MAG: DNA-binding response regulator [Bacteroidetes bacterium]|nr:MAG: DNA-binding response regulator [Bacteroidota bacterium]
MAIRTIIIDDERLARKELAEMLKDYDNIEIIAEADNPQEAIKLIDKEKPDLIFLDINMPEINGFELLEKINHDPKVIFVTAYDEYAIKAIKTNALDYIVKPVEKETLSAAIEKMTEIFDTEEKPQHQLSENDIVFLKDGEKCWLVEIKDIRFFESTGNYVKVFFKDFKPLILRSLNSLEKRLPEKIFFRANRKHIVNLRHVTKIQPWYNGGYLLEISSGDKIEVSRRQASKLKEVFTL